MGAKQSGTTTTTQTNPLQQLQAPFLSQEFGDASNLLGNANLNAFPGQTVAPVGPQTYQALGQDQALALSGDPVANAADSTTTNLLNGGTNALTSQGASSLNQFANGSMLNNNPFLESTFNQAAQGVDANIASQMNMAGRTGSGAQQAALSSGLNNLATNIYGQNYQNQTGLMENAGAQLANAGQGLNQTQTVLSSLAPSLTANDFSTIGQLGNVGMTSQALQQPYINEAMQAFGTNQASPFNSLNAFGGEIGNPSQAGGTTTSPFFTNPLATGLGAAQTVFGGSGINGTGPSLAGKAKGALGGGAATTAASNTAISPAMALMLGISAL